jgi:hypothetical protein
MIHFGIYLKDVSQDFEVPWQTFHINQFGNSNNPVISITNSIQTIAKVPKIYNTGLDPTIL